MNVSFTSQGWEDLTYRLETDRKVLSRILRLVEDCLRHTHEGIGKPEPLRGDLAGWWSRRIDQEHRLVYRVAGVGDAAVLVIAQCRHHY